MVVQRLGQSTTSVDDLVWSGNGFSDSTADAMWVELSAQLKHVALAEIDAGNIPINILRNESRGNVLLAFQLPPKAHLPDKKAVSVHNSFANGNYCYDGTVCTYEDLESGDFLAFDDPDYVSAL